MPSASTYESSSAHGFRFNPNRNRRRRRGNLLRLHWDCQSMTILANATSFGAGCACDLSGRSFRFGRHAPFASRAPRWSLKWTMNDFSPFPAQPLRLTDPTSTLLPERASGTLHRRWCWIEDLRVDGLPHSIDDPLSAFDPLAIRRHTSCRSIAGSLVLVSTANCSRIRFRGGKSNSVTMSVHLARHILAIVGYFSSQA